MPTAQPLEYDLVRGRRRTVAVSVRDDGSVEVRAPKRASKREIQEVVHGFRSWIEQRRGEVLARARRRDARRFVDGETIPFLGTELTLRIEEVAAAPALPRQERSTLIVPIRAGLSAEARRPATRRQVLRWLIEQSREAFHQRHVIVARRVGASARRITIKEMSTRWGSCGPERRMSLNWRLVLAPLPVLDYVLVHELCHIFEPNHSRAFWRRVQAACVHARASRAWLRRHGDDLEI